MNLENLPFKVIYEDNHLLVVNKPSGILVQGDSTGDTPLVEYVKLYIKHKYNKPGLVFCGITHRLDRPVSGLVIFARTSKALERMNQKFRDREIQKTYWAISEHAPPQNKGQLKHWLVKDEARNVVTAFNAEKPNSQLALLDYQLLAQKQGHNLLEVHPITGRPHQIRVQLAKIGSVIVSDLKYGYDKTPFYPNQIYLHSRKVTFEHPVKKELINLEAPLPDFKLWDLFR